MKDANGDEVVVGEACEFRSLSGKWTRGTVRSASVPAGVPAGLPMARCDNGDPGNDDLHSNGMTKSAWVGSRDIRMLTDAPSAVAPKPAPESPRTIAAVVRREGNKACIELDMNDTAAALDDECAKLRERLAEVERERDAARNALIDEQHAHESTRITLEQRDNGYIAARRMKDEAWARVQQAQRERGSIGRQLAAANEILDATLAVLPVGHIPEHTRERIPEMVEGWVDAHAKLDVENEDLRAQLAAMPIGPAKDAPDASSRMWLMTGGGNAPTWFRIVSWKWIRRHFRQLTDHVPRDAKWYRFKVQP